jgi:hypothetical protein
MMETNVGGTARDLRRTTLKKSGVTSDVTRTAGTSLVMGIGRRLIETDGEIAIHQRKNITTEALDAGALVAHVAQQLRGGRNIEIQEIDRQHVEKIAETTKRAAGKGRAGHRGKVRQHN